VPDILMISLSICDSKARVSSSSKLEGNWGARKGNGEVILQRVYSSLRPEKLPLSI
jgi:hypothetical protein